MAGHTPGVRLSVRGDFEEEFLVEWTEIIGLAHQTSWSDWREAAEYAAMGLSILMMQELAEYRKFVRKDQGEEGDIAMWKGLDANRFFEEARMEVSGLLKDAPGNSLNMRVFSKRRQVLKYPNQNRVTFVTVVEFATPKAKIIAR